MFIFTFIPKNNIRLRYYEFHNYLNKFPENIPKYNRCFNKHLRQSEKSLALKHYESLRLISTMDIDYGLVIEDDCVFCNNFYKKLEDKMKEFPLDWDIYISNSKPNPGFRTKGGFKTIKNTKKINIKNHPASLFGISYLITKNAAKQIVEEIENKKIYLPIDHEYNWIFYKLKLKVIWNWVSPQLTYWNKSGLSSSLI